MTCVETESAKPEAAAVDDAAHRTGRFVMGVTGWETLGVEIVQAIIWSCLALSVPLADVANNWIEIRGAVAAPVKSRVPAKQNLTDTAVETI